MTLLARTTSAQTPTVSGAFSVEPATLLSLGFDWRISGDDNRNAHVDVTFRKKGDAAWRTGLPLLRLQREVINGVVPGPNPTPNLARSPFDYVVPNMFSGSLLNLQPDTEYEARFTEDPDAVAELEATARLKIGLERLRLQASAGGKSPKATASAQRGGEG